MLIRAPKRRPLLDYLGLIGWRKGTEGAQLAAKNSLKTGAVTPARLMVLGRVPAVLGADLPVAPAPDLQGQRRIRRKAQVGP
jgi:hypothetical protein